MKNYQTGLRAFNDFTPAGRYLFIPLLRTESQMGQTKSVKRKIAKKQTGLIQLLQSSFESNKKHLKNNCLNTIQSLLIVNKVEHLRNKRFGQNTRQKATEKTSSSCAINLLLM